MYYSSFLSFSSVLFFAIAGPISTLNQPGSVNSITTRDVDSKIRSALSIRELNLDEEQLQSPGFDIAEETVQPGDNAQGANDQPNNSNGQNEVVNPVVGGQEDERSIVILHRHYRVNTGVLVGESAHQVPVNTPELQDAYDKVMQEVKKRQNGKQAAEDSSTEKNGHDGQTEEFKIYQSGDDSVSPFAGFQSLPLNQKNDLIRDIAYAILTPSLAAIIVANEGVIIQAIAIAVAAF